MCLRDIANDSKKLTDGNKRRALASTGRCAEQIQKLSRDARSAVRKLRLGSERILGNIRERTCTHLFQLRFLFLFLSLLDQPIAPKYTR
jgi:hypothetical protein